MLLLSLSGHYRTSNFHGMFDAYPFSRSNRRINIGDVLDIGLLEEQSTLRVQERK
jgi:hypothetical protein